MSSRGRAQTAVFVDSAALYALTDKSSVDHREAHAILRRLVARRTKLLTSNFVVAEPHALVLNRLGRHTAHGFLEWVDQSNLVVVRVTAADERRACVIIDAYDDKDFTLTDATSFAVMERFGMVEAFTFDRHFRQYGFAVFGLDS